MHDGFCSFRRLARVTVLLVFPAAAAFGQATADPSAGPPPATAAQAAADEDACPPMAMTDIPFNQTLQAKVTGLLDSGRLKPGKEIWLKIPTESGEKIWLNLPPEENYPGCALDADATIYAHITVASSSKNPNSSQLGLTIDHADCAGHAKQELKMRIVGVAQPQYEWGSQHDAMTSETSGPARQISASAAYEKRMNARLNPGGPPNTVHPGIVVGMKSVKLKPQGGPGCSALLSSSERSIQLAAGTLLILVLADGQ
jgi:hypothetical protein